MAPKIDLSRLKIRQACNVFKAKYNNEKDFFILHDFYAMVGGVHFNTENATMKRWWNLSRVVMAVTYFLLTWNICLQFINEKRLEILMNTIQIGAGLIIVLFRTIVIGWNYDFVTSLRRYLNSRRFNRENESSFKIRRQAYEFIHRIVLLFVSNSCLMTAPIFVIQPTAPLQLPFTLNNHVLQTVAQKIYLLMIIQIVINLATNFFVIVMILTGLAAECHILSNAVEKIFEDSISELKNTGPENSSITSDEQFWKAFNRRFNECLTEHRIILQHLTDIRPLLEGTFIITYYTATLNIAAGAFFLISNLDNINLYIYQICHYTIVLTLECFVFTYFTTRLVSAVSMCNILRTHSIY